jgi:crossover junction endodeoxyribonuclease RuvC
MFIIGFDPGVAGALAALELRPEIKLQVLDMPTHKLRIGKTERARTDLHSLWLHVQALAAGGPALAIVEDVNGYGGKGQSASGAFVFGHAAGAVEALIVAASIPLHKVPPATWKRALSIPADKDAARRAASRLFPAFSHLWSRVKDDGRAEAALLAWYGALHVLGSAR